MTGESTRGQVSYPLLVIGEDGFYWLGEGSGKLERAPSGFEIRSEAVRDVLLSLLLPQLTRETSWSRVRAAFSRCFPPEKDQSIDRPSVGSSGRTGP
jgi:hypothetical protein